MMTLPTGLSQAAAVFSGQLQRDIHKMQLLCYLLGYLLGLVVVTIASPPESEPVEVAKRLATGNCDDLPSRGMFIGGCDVGFLLGDNGLKDGLLGDVGFVGGLIGGESGLLGDILGGENGILGGVLGLKADVLSGLIKTIVSVLGGILKSIVSVIQNLTKGLEGKTTEPEIYAEFRKYDVKQLCPACPSLPNAQHVAACQKYCSEQGYKR